MSGFDTGREHWLSRLGRLRNVVRQEMVARQLDAHLTGRDLRVLDVGCGQGTQALRLARRGHLVTGLDPSAEMLAAFGDELTAEPAEVQARVRLVQGDGLAAARVAGSTPYDVVLCHGVLMYLPDPAPMVAALAAAVAPGGLVSVVARNGEALAMRPGMRGLWADALAAFDQTGYVNELGVAARADTVDGLRALLEEAGLRVQEWYGVRVLSDWVDAETPPPEDPDQLAALLDAEEQAGRRDPYRRVATLVHLVSRRG